MAKFTKELDPITLEVVQLSFVNIVREMRATLIRTSYSPVLYETHDFSCGLLDPKSQLIGLYIDVPAHIFPLVIQTDVILKRFGDDIHPGDIFMTNDPYTGGTHLNDVAVVYPFFFDNKFSAMIAVRAHFTDVGGATPGSLSGKATEIYQEGIRIPPVRICEKGKMDNGLIEVIFSNMRLARDREGDFLSMLDTCRTGEVRLKQLWAKYSMETVERCIDAILDRSEQYMRKIISQIPDGVWYYEHYLESSGTSAEPLPIKGKMEIKGDTATFDFSGAAPQVKGPVNLGPAGVPTAVFIAIKSLLDPLSPVNSGSFRPIKVINPEGTFLNARLPAACGGSAEARRPILWLVIALISQAMAEVAVGGIRAGANHTMIGGWDPVRKKDFILYEYYMGGSPGSVGTDGSHCVASFDSADIYSFRAAEPLENEQPIRVQAIEMRMDSEGAGRHRGGLGMRRRVINMGEGSLLSVLATEAIIPPFGASGGYSAATNAWTVIRKGERIAPSDVPGKIRGFPLEYGDVLEIETVGAGGYGDPLTREVELVKQDVLNEHITKERAQEVYGVVMVNGEVDLAKTEELREQLRRQRIYLKVIASEEDDYDKVNCRLCRVSSQLASRLGVTTGNLVEYVAKEGAPLRAWVKVAPDLTGEESPLGPRGRSILQVDEGGTVEIRALGGLPRKLE